MKRVVVTLGLFLACLTGEVSANPVIAGSAANGDATLLASYEFPASLKDEFESASRSAAAYAVENGHGMWLMYEQASNIDSSNTIAYFTVHFPDNLDELTEPASTTSGLIAEFGKYRVRAELTRQVPDWCSTVSIDAEKLEYGYVEYLWLEPNSLDDVGLLLAERGEILRSVYGSESDGNLATEGFVSMVAPFQVMLVLFSSESSRAAAAKQLEKDLEAGGHSDDWDRMRNKLDAYVSKRETLSGRFRRELSAYW
ncbi:MAG: hypothetical protein QNJ00_00955 [Woeseiaceae bacterium]|nr:hypothetical protein [Woeseiaceae bacterium]